MRENYDVIYKKILDYWNKYDGNDFDAESLRKVFDADELACILFDYNFGYYDRIVIPAFIKKIKKNPMFLFSEKEAERLVYIYPDTDLLLTYCSDEFLVNYIDDNDYLIRDAIENIKKDEYLELAFEKVKDSFLRSIIVLRMNSSELKMKYLKKLPINYQTSAIVSSDDEYLIEKYISVFRGGKDRLISMLNSDDKKIHYFKKYFTVLTAREKAEILASLDDKDIALYYLKFMNDYVKGCFVGLYSFVNWEYAKKVLFTINNKKVLSELMMDGSIPEEYYDKFIDCITNQNQLETFITGLSNDELIVKYFPRLSYKRQIEFIREIEVNTNLKFRLLKHVTKPKDIISIIEHSDKFPEYNDDFDTILEVYSNVYHVDKERLKFIVKNISFFVLKYIENENIMKMLSSNEKDFNLLMQIFNKEKLKMTQSSLNDIINSFLQRRFRLEYPETIFIFSFTLTAIENGDKGTVVKKIMLLDEKVNLREELTVYNWSISSFVDSLMDKEQKAIDFLHLITAKYIRQERNRFVQDNLENVQKECVIKRYDKNDLMRYFINNLPVEVILGELNRRSSYDSLLDDKERELKNNSQLLTDIIMYKKNPTKYDKIPDEVKANLKTFNSLFEKKCVRLHYGVFANYNGKVNTEFLEVDGEFLASILMYIDIDKLKNGLFNNPDMFNKFMKFWEQYKIGGWNTTFNSLLSSAGLVVDPEIVASFVHYFGLSYEHLLEKKEKNEIQNISLTALLDLAFCYSTESKKYSLLFGEEDFRLIASNPIPNASSMTKEKRLNKAVDFVKIIRDRDYVTVPPVDKTYELSSGKQLNVVVGNFSNMMNLTYGERTGACMRIGGAGSSLFDFCLENDNGFHIRFENPKTGNFVSRVSGFRNGNTVFLNQLRFSEDAEYTNKDVSEACKLISQELIERSKDSSMPIDNVVISSDLAMKSSGIPPKKLNISNPQRGMKKFYIDVGSHAILIASSGPNNSLVTPNLGVRRVPKYEVLRDKKKILYNKDAFLYVAHLHMLDRVLDGSSIDSINVELNEEIVICLAGEDWYVTIDKKGNIDKYIMRNSNSKDKAIDEVQEAMNYLKDNLSKEMQIASNVMGM